MVFIVAASSLYQSLDQLSKRKSSAENFGYSGLSLNPNAMILQINQLALLCRAHLSEKFGVVARHYQKYYQQSITELELQGVSNPEDLDKYQRSRILCEKEYPRYKKTADQLG